MGILATGRNAEGIDEHGVLGLGLLAGGTAASVRRGRRQGRVEVAGRRE